MVKVRAFCAARRNPLARLCASFTVKTLYSSSIVYLVSFVQLHVLHPHPVYEFILTIAPLWFIVRQNIVSSQSVSQCKHENVHTNEEKSLFRKWKRGGCCVRRMICCWFEEKIPRNYVTDRVRRRFVPDTWNHESFLFPSSIPVRITRTEHPKDEDLRHVRTNLYWVALDDEGPMYVERQRAIDV